MFWMILKHAIETTWNWSKESTFRRTHSQPSSIILPSNKVHCYGTLERLGVLVQSTPFIRHFSHFWLHLQGSQFFVRYLTILLSWLSLRHCSDTMSGITTLHNGMILSMHNLSWLCFGLYKRPHKYVFLT